jgi:hypothetical protein
VEVEARVEGCPSLVPTVLTLLSLSISISSASVVTTKRNVVPGIAV